MPRKKESVRVKFGRRVRALREESGRSQEEFANVAGIDRSYYGEIERGEVNVSLETIASIAKALKLSVSELCDWE